MYGANAIKGSGNAVSIDAPLKVIKQREKINRGIKMILFDGVYRSERIIFNFNMEKNTTKFL